MKWNKMEWNEMKWHRIQDAVIHGSSWTQPTVTHETYSFRVKYMTQRVVNSKVYGNIWPISTLSRFSLTLFVIYGQRERDREIGIHFSDDSTQPTDDNQRKMDYGFFLLLCIIILCLSFFLFYFALCSTYLNSKKCPWVNNRKCFMKNQFTNVK